MRPDLTQLLIEAQKGHQKAIDELYKHVYDELHRIAHLQLRRRQATSSLNTTALVHEAYLKLFDPNRIHWQDRVHFFALSAQAMRQILVDQFRRQHAKKRGGEHTVIRLEEGQVPVEERGEALLALDAALKRLTLLNERLARVVECKFFGEMTEEQISELLNVTPRTVRSDWRKARVWLTRELLEV